MTRTPSHCHRRATEVAKAAYATARANPDQAEGLEAMRAINDFLIGAAVQEVETATRIRPLDLARALQ